MTDEAGTPAGEGGEGSGGSEVVNSIPSDWSENESYKEFYGEDKTFDFARFGESYTAAKENQAVVPETSDDYKFEFPDGEYHTDDADVKLQRDMAKEAGLTQAQYETMVKFDVARFAKAQAEIAMDMKDTKDALVKEWGGTEKFEANMAAAAKVAIAIFGQDFQDRIDLGNDMQLIKGLYLMSQKLSEDTLKTGQGVNTDQRKIGVDGEQLFSYGT